MHGKQLVVSSAMPLITEIKALSSFEDYYQQVGHPMSLWQTKSLLPFSVSPDFMNAK